MKKFKILWKTSLNWWNNLSLSDKQEFKSNYEKILSGKNNYPHLVDTTKTRISKLSENQIHCIWRFKEHKNKT